MLENSNLIEGQNAKEVNRLVAEYQDITAKLQDLEKTKKETLAKLFELTEIGTNETNKFVFNVVDNNGRQTISIKTLTEKAPELFNLIETQGFVNVGENFKTIRGIKLKGQRA